MTFVCVKRSPDNLMVVGKAVRITSRRILFGREGIVWFRRSNFVGMLTVYLMSDIELREVAGDMYGKSLKRESTYQVWHRPHD